MVHALHLKWELQKAKYLNLFFYDCPGLYFVLDKFDKLQELLEEIIIELCTNIKR